MAQAELGVPFLWLLRMPTLGVRGFRVTAVCSVQTAPQSCAAGSASPSWPENSGLQAHAAHSLVPGLVRLRWVWGPLMLV